MYVLSEYCTFHSFTYLSLSRFITFCSCHWAMEKMLLSFDIHLHCEQVGWNTNKKNSSGPEIMKTEMSILPCEYECDCCQFQSIFSLSFPLSLPSVCSLELLLFMQETVSNQQCPLVLVSVHHLTQKPHNFRFFFCLASASPYKHTIRVQRRWTAMLKSKSEKKHVKKCQWEMMATTTAKKRKKNLFHGWHEVMSCSKFIYAVYQTHLFTSSFAELFFSVAPKNCQQNRVVYNMCAVQHDIKSWKKRGEEWLRKKPEKDERKIIIGKKRLLACYTNTKWKCITAI